MSKSKIILIITLLLLMGQIALYYINSPQMVAIHFGKNGMPDSWSSKETSSLIMIGVLVFINLMWLGMPKILKKVPRSLINFPKKEYWLADENIDKSIPLICPWFYIFGAATNLFFIIAQYLAYMANKGIPAKLDSASFMNAFLIYMVFLVVWIIMFFKKFNKIPEKY
ncbi:DUF1648 domain-containing protein [Spirochaetota bacterium]